MEKLLTTDEEILEYYGWTEICQSPYEISTKDGSFASGEATHYVIEGLKREYLIEKYDELMDELDELKTKNKIIVDLNNRKK